MGRFIFAVENKENMRPIEFRMHLHMQILAKEEIYLTKISKLLHKHLKMNNMDIIIQELIFFKNLGYARDYGYFPKIGYNIPPLFSW